MSLFEQTMPQFLKMFANLDGWLDKAQAFCEEQDIELEALLEQRLFPNMYTLRGQIQFASHNATLLADRLSGIERPEESNDEQSFDEVRARVIRTKAYLERVVASGKSDGEAEMVGVPAVPGMQIRGADMTRDFSVPNVIFHLTTVYGILRQLDVPVGKADFLGAIALVPEAA